MTLPRTLAVALAFGLAGFSSAEDKKTDEKKADKFDATKMVGEWSVTSGKINGKDISDDVKKGAYTITKDKITLAGADGKSMFVFGYTVDAKTSPVNIDMEIKESVIEGAKGNKAVGIVELAGDELKITYSTGTDRPKKVDDDKAYAFVLKRKKDEKKKP